MRIDLYAIEEYIKHVDYVKCIQDAPHHSSSIYETIYSRCIATIWFRYQILQECFLRDT